MATAEILRDVGAASCTLLLGMNLAFVIHERRREDRVAWRVFVVGKSLVTAYVGLDLWQQGGGWGWRLPLAFAGVTTAHAGIFALLLGRRLRRRIAP